MERKHNAMCHGTCHLVFKAQSEEEKILVRTNKNTEPSESLWCVDLSYVSF